MLPKDKVYGDWPASGEIDIMESTGNAPNKIGSTMHWGPDYLGNRFNLTHQEFQIANGSSTDNFHIFGLQWNETTLTTYVDDSIVLQTPLNNFFSRGGYPSSVNNPWKSGTSAAPFDQGMVELICRILSNHECRCWRS